MQVHHHYSSNHFPYTFIVLSEHKNQPQLLYTYLQPDSGVYPDWAKGRWRIKYKFILPGFHCEGQRQKEKEKEMENGRIVIGEVC